MENKRSANLCTTYILPLLDLNKFSFGEPGNLVGSYLSLDLTSVIVKTKRNVPGLINHKLYKFSFEQEDLIHYIFEFPSTFNITAAKFKVGKYSQFQDQIYAYHEALLKELHLAIHLLIL